MTQRTTPLPIPDLEPRPITFDDYSNHTPEKLELLGGYLIDPQDELDERRRLLALLLVNVGLLEAVKLAPEPLWREALKGTYGRPAR